MRHLIPKVLALTVLYPLLLNCPFAAAETLRLVVDGEVTTPLDLSEADFKKLPRTSLQAKDAGGNDVKYEGVDLAVILLAAGTPLKDGLKGADVAKYLHAEGADSFAAVFSLPEFDSTTFLVADTATGPLFRQIAGLCRLSRRTRNGIAAG